MLGYDLKKILADGKNIRDLKLRVTYYCRVSTETDEQLNSLSNQVDYYVNYIKNNKNWEFVDGYIEKCVSGTTTNKRESFKRMIQDAKSKKFDLIIIKEASRFARDVVDGPSYVRQLSNAGVAVLFETQGLTTFDISADYILTILFGLAQEESKRLSARVKFGHAQAIKNGVVLGSNNILGYQKDKGKLVIVPTEAEVVKLIFKMYVTNQYGCSKIARQLGEMGHFNSKGKLYSKHSITRFILNPKYKGYYRAREFETIDYRTKKRKRNSIENQIIYKCEDGSIPAIISEELWDEAQEIIKIRAKKYGRVLYTGGLKYPFSSKIFCSKHNCRFQRTRGNDPKRRTTWSCNYYLEHRSKGCKSPLIPESDLYAIMSKIMQYIIPKNNTIASNMLKMYEKIEKTEEYAEELNKIITKKNKIEKEKTTAISLITKGLLTEKELETQFNYFKEKLKTLQEKETLLINKIEMLKKGNNNIIKLKKYIQEEINGNSLDDFIKKFVKEIIVSKINDDRYDVKLDIYLNLSGVDNPKIIGSSRKDGALDNDLLILSNQQQDTTEIVRSDRKVIKYTYNLYNS